MRANTRLSEATSAHGGLSACARMIGVRPPTLHQWIKGLRPVPPRRCHAIEYALAVRRWDLRPNDWHLIWPELVRAPGAPAVTESAPGAGPPQEDSRE
ncbi:transcriptional regulator [Thiomonas delicata]|nr:YdaS family helix-turn-helix protein [Thiomonas delicata]